MIFRPLYPVQRGEDSAAAQRAIGEFVDSGNRGVTHSRRGLLLHHILNYCVAMGVGFILDYDPVGARYVVRRR